MSGLFVAFEGGEGAGKSTQITLLAAWLRRRGHRPLLTREPGATPLGERIRAILLDPAAAPTARAEALLYAADRAQHVDTVLRPALAAGQIVLTDRFMDSSLAYQGGGRELHLPDVRRLSDWASAGLRPDLTVVLDIDPRVGLARAAGRCSPDRIEQETGLFHLRVRAAFLQLAAADTARYLVLDAGAPAEIVAERVQARMAALLTARRVLTS